MEMAVLSLLSNVGGAFASWNAERSGFPRRAWEREKIGIFYSILFCSEVQRQYDLTGDGKITDGDALRHGTRSVPVCIPTQSVGTRENNGPGF